MSATSGFPLVRVRGGASAGAMRAHPGLPRMGTLARARARGRATRHAI